MVRIISADVWAASGGTSGAFAEDVREGRVRVRRSQTELKEALMKAITREASQSQLYVREEHDGFFALRQTRYRARLEAGQDHPHDVCAVARSREELRTMCETLFPDVDYGVTEDPRHG
jgi:hypothetical protein